MDSGCRLVILIMIVKQSCNQKNPPSGVEVIGSMETIIVAIQESIDTNIQIQLTTSKVK